MEIIFATGNEHKVNEIQSLCPDFVQLKSLKQIGFIEAVPETSPTIAGNSLQKATFIFQKTFKPVMAEDTGLEVVALKGLPGVNTARYAGVNASFEDNIRKLLNELQGETIRDARFITVITFIDELGKVHQFEGICEGEILLEKAGEKGFGYDPVFKPKGSDKSFAQMELQEKHLFSHRAKAFQQLMNFLQQNV